MGLRLSVSLSLTVVLWLLDVRPQRGDRESELPLSCPAPQSCPATPSNHPRGSLLLNESDLSALAEASLRLEELEATVGRILSQVERATQQDDDDDESDQDIYELDTSPERDTYSQPYIPEEAARVTTYQEDSPRSPDPEQCSVSCSETDWVLGPTARLLDEARSFHRPFDYSQAQDSGQSDFEDDTTNVLSCYSHSVYEPSYERYNYRDFEQTDDLPRNYEALESYKWAESGEEGNPHRVAVRDTSVHALQARDSCSLEDLEKCIDRLVEDVQKMEARLRKELIRKENLEARCGRFSLPAPPRALRLRSAHSASMDSVAVGSNIWWEGAYRNVRYTPEGQESSVSSLSSTESDGDEPRGSVMLLVRTTEEGKDQIEIRSTRHRELHSSDTNNNDPDLSGRVLVHSPPDRPEMYSSSGTSQRRHSRSLEFSPPASLVQYVYPSAGASDARSSADIDTDVQYVSPTAMIPSPSYCTWYPSTDSLEQPRRGGGKTRARATHSMAFGLTGFTLTKRDSPLSNVT